METNNSKKTLARSYCRTSGKNFTSISNQKKTNEKFIADNGWDFGGHYVDEAKSGAKIAGRDDFKRMLKEAANDEFNILVPFDISRFARDGFDIIQQSYFLKNNFDVDVIGPKGFDTRKPKNALLNFIFAGVAQDERLRIMERTRHGNISNAENGLQWSGKPPFGRAFKRTGKQSGDWYITEDGKKIKKILEAYVNENKSFRELAREHGIKSAQLITRRVREAQLAADPYKVVFNSPEIDIVNYEVLVPAVPPVISTNLEKRVLAKMALNHKTKRNKKRNYLLSGMVRCAHCGKFLKGQSQRGRSYYTHNNFYADRKPCPYNGIRLEILETHVMDYLTNFFVDELAFEQAVKAALPTNDDREMIIKDIQANNRDLNRASVKISNFAKAIGDGEKLTSLLDALKSAEAEKEALQQRDAELQETLDTMPDPETIKVQADKIRMRLMVFTLTESWQNRSYEDLRRFLHFLFSDNPRQNHYGILLGKKDEKWHIGFEGCVDFQHSLITDDRINDEIHNAYKQINAETRVMFEKGVKEADKKAAKARKKLDDERNEDIEACKKAEKALKGNPLFNDKDYL